MENHALGLVYAFHPVADGVSHDRRQRRRLRRDHMDVEAPLLQGAGDFQPDEARADHHHALGRLGGGDDRVGVFQRAQDVHVWPIQAGDRRPLRFGAGGEDQGVIGQRVAALERNGPGLGIEARDLGVHPKINLAIRVEGVVP